MLPNVRSHLQRRAAIIAECIGPNSLLNFTLKLQTRENTDTLNILSTISHNKHHYELIVDIFESFLHKYTYNIEINVYIAEDILRAISVKWMKWIPRPLSIYLIVFDS